MFEPSLFTDFTVNVIVAVVSGGVCLSPLGTKIKDFFKGVPSDLRTALGDVETDAVAKLKAAKVVAAPVVKKAASPAAAIVAAAAASVAALPVAPAPVPQAAPLSAPAPLVPPTV